MKRMLKVVAAPGIAFAAVPLLVVAVAYGAAQYQRFQAQRLLTLVRTLKPGVTTEGECRQLLQPLERHLHYSRGFIKDQRSFYGVKQHNPSFIADDYQVYNYPDWMQPLFAHTIEPLREFIANHLMPNWTMFAVSLNFQNDRLAKLHVIEMQGMPKGGGGAFAAKVNIYADQVPDDEDYFSPDRPFTGYGVNTQKIDRLLDDRPLAKPRPIHTNVLLDGRATPEELRRALDFQVDCFVKACLDASQLLDPAPNR